MKISLKYPNKEAMKLSGRLCRRNEHLRKGRSNPQCGLGLLKGGIMKISSAKAKGRRLQQWVRDQLLSHRELSEGDVRSTSMGAGGVDVQLSPAAKALYPFSIECKSKASYAFYKDYEQAVANTEEGTEPVLVVKANNKRPVVIIDAEYFFKRW
jgi:hypothetical protein